MERNRGTEQDEEEPGRRDVEEDRDDVCYCNTVQLEKEYPGPGLDRDDGKAGGNLSGDHLRERDRRREEGIEGLALVLLGDEVDDQGRRYDRREEDEQRDEEAVDELVETLRIAGVGEVQPDGEGGHPVGPHLPEFPLVALEDLLDLHVDDARLQVVLDEVEGYRDRSFGVGGRIGDIDHRRDLPVAQCCKRRGEVHPVQDEVVVLLELVDEG